jgi:hypothetical protein
MIIEDGKGTGYKAKVDLNNLLRVSAVMEPSMHFTSLEDGQVFVWSNVTYDYAAGDTILLVKNTSTDKHLHIVRVICSTDTNTQIIVHCPDCTTPTGTAVTGVNLNRMSGNVAEAIAKADETTNSQGDIVCTRLVPANNNSECIFDEGLILGLNDCIAVDYVTDGGSALVAIFGMYHPGDE